MAIATSVIGFTQVGGSLLDIATASHPEPTTEKVDAIVQPLLKTSDPYHSLINIQKSTECLSKPRRIVEGSLAVVALVEGASIPINQFSTTSSFLSNLSTIFSCAQAVAAFLTFGIAATVLTAIDGAWSAFKAIQFNKEIENVKAAKEALDPAMGDIQAFLDTELKILELRRDESYENIFLAVVIVALFIIANVLSCGLAGLIVLGVLAIVISVYKIKNSRNTDKKVALLSKQLVSSESKGSYGNAAIQLANPNLRKNPFNAELINKTGHEIIKGLIIAYREAGELDEFNAELVRIRLEDLQLPPIQ